MSLATAASVVMSKASSSRRVLFSRPPTWYTARLLPSLGTWVVMTTQVPNEGSNLAVYHVGGRLKSTLRLLEAFDMTTEAAVAKLMWILGQTRDFDEAEKLFYQPVARDILYEN